MKPRWTIPVALLLMITTLAVVLVCRKDLCEVRFRSDHTEVIVLMAYESR